MNKANYLGKSDFPLDREGLDFIQNMILSVSKLAQLGGSNYILSGCIEADGVVGSGTIVLQGEIFEFEGGAKKDYISIVETKEELSTDEETYPEAYTFRKAVFADAGDYSWIGLNQVSNIVALFDLVTKVKEEPIGTIDLWPGSETTLPENYMLCDGRELNKSEYPKLFDVIGQTYGGSGNVFRLPNMRGRVPVGYNPDDTSEYELNKLGNTGGAQKHKLSINELASHSHGVKGSSADNGDAGVNFIQSPNDQINAGTTETSGDDQPHNNMQPFIVLNYKIKVK